MRMAFIALGLLAFAAVAALAYVRLAPNPPERWHVDPAAVTPPSTPNFHLIRPGEGPVFAMTPEALAARLDDVARDGGAERLAGSPEAGHVTYITRTRWIGFPDFTSIRVLPAEDGATVAAFTRARFGVSDMGANRARLEGWLAALRDAGP